MIRDFECFASLASCVFSHSLGLLHPSVSRWVVALVLVLNVYKPRGMTRYGWRKQQEERKASQK